MIAAQLDACNVARAALFFLYVCGDTMSNVSMGSPLPAGRKHETAAPAWKRTGRRSRRRRAAMSPYTWYAIAGVGVLILVFSIHFIYSTATSDPPVPRQMAARELRLNTLARGERVLHQVPVFQRPAVDYLRATRGLLVLTDRRLLFLGVEPPDLAAAPDEPPTFTERDFPLDTIVHVTAGRTFFGFARAVVIATPQQTFRLGVPSRVWPAADRLLTAIAARTAKERARAERQNALTANVDAAIRATEEIARRPRLYTVRRGDALSSIAKRWNTTPERLQLWNHLTTNRIRVGQSLIVKPAD